jgi:hypothetical protein
MTRVHDTVVAIACALASCTLFAHHGTASFDVGKELTLKGVVTEWIWANPHCFLKFDVKDESGATKSWMVETQNPTDMSRRGWARTSFKAGDAVSVKVEPVKGTAPVGRILSVVLPDGNTLWAVGGPAAAPAP